MTVAILSIVLTIGVPSFVDTIRNNRLATGSNELAASFALARSEAARQGIQVSVCPRSGNACADSLNWSSGWLVFTDDIAPTGTIDGTDAVLQTSATRDTPVSITSDQKSVTYSPLGVRTKTNLTVTQSGCKGKNKRVLTVELTGRVSLKKDNC
jgi:type IV fimbrial biogenesis protein FimT